MRVQAETNPSKLRRYNKQLKQYDDTIKAVEAGKEVDVFGLPIPAGAPPLPGEEDEANNSTETPAKTSKCQKQLEFLQNRHEEFKKAAIRARDNGNKQEAMLSRQLRRLTDFIFF